MRNSGYVISVREDRAEVVLGAHLECKHCGACIAAMSEKERKLDAINEIGALPGQRVEIELRPGYAVRAAFLIFVLPVIAAVGGGLAGYSLGGMLGLRRDLAGIGLGSLALVLSFVLLRYIEKTGSTDRIPRVVGLITDEDPQEGECP
ncbi:MAG: SoxR reducing system RseC family protein [Candidatus Eisenbacteria bacterium]